MTDTDTGEAVDARWAGDLAVAKQALAGDRGALIHIESLVQAAGETLRRFEASVAVQDVLQETRTRLLVGDSPRLGQYTGRGPLGAFIRVVAHRLAIEATRSSGRRVPLAGDSALERLIASEEPELDHVRDRHARDFKAAFEEALRELPREERSILRLRVIDGLSPVEIGEMLGVHRATIARRVAAAREAVQLRVYEILAARLRVTSSEARSLFGIVQGGFDVSVARALGSVA